MTASSTGEDTERDHVLNPTDHRETGGNGGNRREQAGRDNACSKAVSGRAPGHRCGRNTHGMQVGQGCRSPQPHADPPTAGSLNSALWNSANLRQAASRNSSRTSADGRGSIRGQIGIARQPIGVDIRTREVSCRYIAELTYDQLIDAQGVDERGQSCRTIQTRLWCAQL